MIPVAAVQAGQLTQSDEKRFWKCTTSANCVCTQSVDRNWTKQRQAAPTNQKRTIETGKQQQPSANAGTSLAHPPGARTIVQGLRAETSR
eukprot:1504435-Rhodomonas_salina.1